MQSEIKPKSVSPWRLAGESVLCLLCGIVLVRIGLGALVNVIGFLSLSALAVCALLWLCLYPSRQREKTRIAQAPKQHSGDALSASFEAPQPIGYWEDSEL